MSVNIQIPVSYFNLGSNNIRFEYKNELGEEGSWESIVIRKLIDSFYISESHCSISLTVTSGRGLYFIFED